MIFSFRQNMFRMILLRKIYRRTNPSVGLSLLYTLRNNTRKDNFIKLETTSNSGNGIYIRSLHEAQTAGRICPHVDFLCKYLPTL